MKKQKPDRKKSMKKQNKQTTIITYLKEIPCWVVCVIFALTTCIFFWDQLFGNFYFWEDFVEYVFPTQTFAAREFAEGGIPFWNPYTFVGMPFFADLQVGFLYPINRFLSLFVTDAGRLPIEAVQFVTILHFFIAQTAMYFFVKYFKISSWGAIISSISYGFSMILVCHVIHPMMLHHLSWFPLVLMLFLKAIDTEDIRFSIWSGLILGISFLAGHPQTALYEGLFLGLMFLWFFIAKLRANENKPNILKLIIAGLLPVIIAAGIFSVQYLPSQVLADNSQREEISYERSTEGSLHFRQITTSIVPGMFGSVEGNPDVKPNFYLKFRGSGQMHFYWETAYYFGIAALILGLFAITYLIKTKTAGFFIFIAVFGFLYALGENFFFFDIFYNFPLFGSFRNPGRIMFFTVIAFCLLSGFGFDLLWKNIKDSKALKRLILVTIVPFIIALLTATGTLPSSFDAPEMILSDIKGYGVVAVFLVLAVFAFAYAVNRNLLNPMAGATAIAIILFIDLNIAGGNFNKSPNDPEDVYKLNQQTKQVLQANPPEDIFRVSMRLYRPSFMAFNRNQGMMDEIMLIEGYNPLILKKVLPPAPEINPERSRQMIHDLYNVKYDIGATQQGGYGFVQRRNFFPRAWLVDDYQVMDAEEIERTMKNKYHNFANTVFLESKPVFPSSTENSNGKSVKCIVYSNDYIKYEVISDKNNILVFSEIFYPAWKAYINDKETQVIRANYSFRAIAIPAGKHIVEMRYESSAFNTGLIISIIVLIASVAGLLLIRPKKAQ